MRVAKATGPNAQAIKYDILTALGAHGCAGDKSRQRLVLRFVTLIVARYNWTLDLLAIGQKEIAALWSIDERSVKRDMAKLRALGWISVKRPAARGRVAEYALGLDAILSQTQGDWDRVGPDFSSRLAGPVAPPLPNANVIAFPAPLAGQGLWSRMQAALHAEDPHLYKSWFAGLVAGDPCDGLVQIEAPSRFHAAYLVTNHLGRLLALAARLDPAIQRVEIIAAKR